MGEEIVRLLEELRSARQAQAERFAGLADLVQLNLGLEARAAVRSLLGRYASRDVLLLGAISALEKLILEGFPAAIPEGEEAEAIILELRRHAAAVEVAVALFESTQAATLGLTAGRPEPK